jgi:hypothetical protein
MSSSQVRLEEGESQRRTIRRRSSPCRAGTAFAHVGEVVLMPGRSRVEWTKWSEPWPSNTEVVLLGFSAAAVVNCSRMGSLSSCRIREVRDKKPLGWLNGRSIPTPRRRCSPAQRIPASIRRVQWQAKGTAAGRFTGGVSAKPVSPGARPEQAIAVLPIFEVNGW